MSQIINRSPGIAVACLAALCLALAGCGASSTGGGAGSSGTTTAGREVRPSPRPTRRERQETSRRRHQVIEAAMVAGEAGWTRTENGVFWTDDDGRTWRRITPPLRGAEALQTVWFADSEHGWALAARGHETAVRASIFATTNGGRSWHRSRAPIPRRILGAAWASFASVGLHLVFALVKAAGDTASNYGFLLVSHDGGRDWRRLPGPPQAGTIAFGSAREGWLAGGSPGPRLWRTEDGGRAWVPVEPPHSGPRRYSEVTFVPPRIGPDGHGVLAAVRGSGGVGKGVHAQIYVTRDHGRRWRLAHRVALPGVGGSLNAIGEFAYLGRSRSLLLHDPITAAFTPVSATGVAGQTFTARHIPHWTSMSFSDARHGFALSSYGPRDHLVLTVDGGHSWRPVPDPAVGRAG